MMQNNSYVEARLGRWARWYHWGPRPGPKRVISWYGPMILDRNVKQNGKVSLACPVDLDEAEETQKAVQALDPELRDIIFETYLKGGTVKQMMRACGIRKRDNYYLRLNRAYRQVLGYMNDVAAGVALPAPKPRKEPRKTFNNHKPLVQQGQSA